MENNNVGAIINERRRRSDGKSIRRTILAHGVDELPVDVQFSHTQHMIAGAMAGAVEHTCMFPVDTIKTRMQSSLTSSPDSGMMQVLRNIRSEGNLRLYSGLSAVLVGAIPSHALYFATYEFAKDCLYNGRLRTSSYDARKNSAPSTWIVATAGIFATMVHDAVSTPLDVIKQRMQLSSKFKSMASCFNHVLKNEGFKAFYISYPTTLLMNAPYTMIHFITYETVKHLLHLEEDEEDHHHDDEEDHHEHHHSEHMWKHIVAGGLAGASGAAVSNPFDVIKTRLQTQGPAEYSGVRDTARRILIEEGMKGFWRGVVPRMLYHTPSAAITWATYEYMKVVFQS